MLHVARLSLLVLLCIAGYNALRKDYSRYHVLKAYISSHADEHIFRQLGELEGVNFWSPSTQLGRNVTFSVSPDSLNTVKHRLRSRHIHFTTKSRDLQSLITEEISDIHGKRHLTNDLHSHLTSYLRHEEINNFLSKVIFQCHPSVVCTTSTIGYSYKGRPLDVIEIGGASKYGKPALWIDAGFHAREWIAPSTALFVVERLINEYKTDALTKALVDSFTWFILPVANPDGYEYTWDHDRLWRKSRSPIEGSECIGVDLNRNFDYHWSDRDGNKPCSATYGGEKPFSETESLSIADYISDKKANLRGYMSFHSYGQLWLLPWAYTNHTKTKDYRELMRVANIGKEAIKYVHNEDYSVGTVPDMLYECGGSSMDWAKATMGIKYSYVIELRDEDGFILPSHHIRPTGEEIWAGIKAMAAEIIKKKKVPTATLR